MLSEVTCAAAGKARVRSAIKISRADPLPENLKRLNTAFLPSPENIPIRVDQPHPPPVAARIARSINLPIAGGFVHREQVTGLTIQLTGVSPHQSRRR